MKRILSPLMAAALVAGLSTSISARAEEGGAPAVEAPAKKAKSKAMKKKHGHKHKHGEKGGCGGKNGCGGHEGHTEDHGGETPKAQ